MGYVLAVTALLLWGLVQIVIKLAKAPGRTGIVVSMVAGLVSLAAIMAARGELVVPQASLGEWIAICINGLCHFSIPTYLYYDAIRKAGITNASPVTRLTPVLVVAGSVALGMTDFSWGVAGSAAMVFVAGLVLARGAHTSHPVENRRDLYVGLGYALVACVLWAVGDILVARLRGDLARSQVLLFGLAFSGVFHLTLLAVTGKLKELRGLVARDYLCYGLHGVVSFALAYWAFFESIQILGVGTAVVITGCWPLVGVLAGIVIFREPMNAMKLAGIVLFVLSAVWAGLGGRLEGVHVSVGYFAAIAAVFLWGAVQIPIRLAKAPGRIGVMVSLPVGLAGAALILLFTGQFSLVEATRSDWLFILATGLIQFPLSTFLYFEAVKRGGITNTTPITRLEPVLVVAASVAFAWAPFSWALVAAAAAIFAGGILLAHGAHRAEPKEGHAAMRSGMLYALFACFAWAAADLLISRVNRGLPMLTVLFYGLGFGTVVHWIVMTAFGQVGQLRKLTGRDWLCYGLQGLGSFSLAYWFLYVSIQRLGVGPATVITGLWPLVGLVGGLVVFRERMNWMKWAGVALLVVAALLSAAAPGV